MVAADYTWAVESYALGLNFCLTFVRGPAPDEVIARLGGSRPVAIAGGAAFGGMEAVAERVDEHGGTHRSGLDYVAVMPAGGWTMVVEPEGFLCSGDEAMRALSSGGEMVSFYYSEHTTPRFAWAVDGREVVGFDPGYPSERDGSDPGRLDGLLRELGFALDPGDDPDAYDEAFRERTFALMERITGVRWDAALLAGATFQCAGVGGVGSRVAAEPWYAEVREELAAYAAPKSERPAARRKREAYERQEEEWRVADLTRAWGGRLPDERLLQSEAEGHARGLVPYDRDLVDRIVEAGPRVQRAMAVWVARYCCTRSGLIANDWVEAAVTALERGDPPPPWFADFDSAFARWRGVPRESLTWSATVSFGEVEPAPIDPAVVAIHVVIAAREEDPLVAVMDTVHNAVESDPDGTIAAFRTAFDLT